MILRLACALAALTGAESAPADESLRDRIDALRAAEAPVVSGDLSADEREKDLEGIAAQAGTLFPDGAAIALFVGPDCAECATARTELLALGVRLDIRVALHDTRKPEAAALLEALSLDSLPAYVMPDRLIRGQMPTFVLERYLSE